MSQLEVFNLIVKPVLADSLGMAEGAIWLPCLLGDDLGATEPEDLVDIVWRLQRKLKEYGLDIVVCAKELEGLRTAVADVLLLVCHKIDAVEVPASEIVTLAKPT